MSQRNVISTGVRHWDFFGNSPAATDLGRCAKKYRWIRRSRETQDTVV